MPRGSRLTAAQIRDEETLCFELRRRGKSLRAISEVATDHFKREVSKDTVDRRVKGYLADHPIPNADEVRQLEVQRLDHYLERLADDVEQGDEKAIATSVRVSESRRKLLGVDMPTRVEVSGEIVTPFDRKMAELNELLGLGDPTLEPVSNALA